MYFLIVHYAATGWACEKFDTESAALQRKMDIESGKLGNGYRYNELYMARQWPIEFHPMNERE